MHRKISYVNWHRHPVTATHFCHREFACLNLHSNVHSCFPLFIVLLYELYVIVYHISLFVNILIIYLDFSISSTCFSISYIDKTSSRILVSSLFPI